MDIKGCALFLLNPESNELEVAAAKLNIQLSVREVSNSNEQQRLLEEQPAEHDAIWLLNSHFLVSHTPYFIEAAIRQKLETVIFEILICQF